MVRTPSILLFFIIPVLLHGQDTSKVFHAAVKYISEQDVDKGFDYTFLDTGSSRLDLFNPTFRNNMIFQDLGNIATPSRKLLFEVNRPVGFQYSENPFGSYCLKSKEAKYFNSHTPYTDATYAQGGGDLLFLKLLHTQNILPRWNAGIDFQRITSTGFLSRQYTSMYNYQIFTGYHSKEKRYVLLANLTWNRAVSEESGGITSDSAYEALTGANRKVYSNLGASETRFKQRTLFLKQYYRWGKSSYQKSEDDSTYDFLPQFQLSHSLEADEVSYIFANGGDTNSVLFPHQYYDESFSTFDSTYYGKLENTIRFDWLGTLARDTSRIIISGALRNQMINVSQIPFIRQHQNTIVDYSMSQMNPKDHATWMKLELSYNLNGYNQGDYKMDAMMSQVYGRLKARIGATLQAYRPDYFFQFYKSNQFIWTNSFTQTTFKGIQLGISSSREPEFSLMYAVFRLNEWVYLNLSDLPAQIKGDVLVHRVDLHKTFNPGKFFFEHHIFWQKSNSTQIHLPEFSGMIRYYIASKMFKELKFKAGFTVFYNSAYYSNAYNPSQRQFYLQDKTLTGNYPLIEPFIIGDIRRASVFIKYEHANQDLIRSGMYYAPHYPLSLASTRVGLRWRFYD